MANRKNQDGAKRARNGTAPKSQKRLALPKSGQKGVNVGGRKKGTALSESISGEATQREIALLKNRFLKNMTLADSAVEAGYNVTTQGSAARVARQVIDKHKDRNSALIQALADEQITEKELAKIIASGLKAERPVKKGQDIEMVPDHDVRHKYLETALDITGSRAPKKVEIEEITFEQRLLELTIEGGTKDLPIDIPKEDYYEIVDGVNGLENDEDEDDGEWPE